MKILISLVLFSSIVAEIFRIPITTSVWVSFVDIMLACCFLVWISWLLFSWKKIKFFKWFYFLFIFLILWFLSLIINIWDLWLNIGESLSSFFYLLRYVFASFLALLVYNLETWEKQFVLKSFFLSWFFILIIWFFQMKYFWNFESMNMEAKGWDPHIWRMLSTWFDPNFLGWYFVFLLSIWIWKIFDLNSKNNEKYYKYLLIILAIGLVVWIVLTFSRSSLVALLTSLFIIGFFLSRKFLIIWFAILLIGMSFSWRMQERVLSWIESARAIINSSQHVLDPTARLRVQSWEAWLKIYNESPVIWVWFNTLKFVQAKKWSFVKGHALSWIDSSILTVMAMTWTLWLIFFSGFLLSILKNSLIVFFKNKKWYSIWLFAWVCSLLVHSIFVNSLFFYALIPSFFVAIWLLQD